MPPDSTGRGPLGDQPDDFPLTKQEQEHLLRLLPQMFRTEQATIEFLVQDMGIPAASIPLFRNVGTPSARESVQDYWTRIFAEFRAGIIINIPFRRLAERIGERKRVIDQVNNAFESHWKANSEAKLTAAPRVRGCHVIVRFTHSHSRAAIQNWLEEEGLAPLEYWVNHDMVSFEVRSPDSRNVEEKIRRRYAHLLVKVLSPHEPDELLPSIMVRDGADAEIQVPLVPVQLTFSELAESTCRFHPAGGSPQISATSDTSHTPSAQVSDGYTNRFPMDWTLLKSRVTENHLVILDSLRFAKIRVTFVSSNPTGNSQHGEARFEDEFETINRIADSKNSRIELAGNFPRARRSDVPNILAQRPHILHVACHGRGGELHWEDKQRDREAIPARLLADDIRDRPWRPKGMLISSCDGEFSGPPLASAAKIVICHPGQVTGSHTLEFTEKFYEELSRTPDLERAARLTAKLLNCEILIFYGSEQGGI